MSTSIPVISAKLGTGPIAAKPRNRSRKLAVTVEFGTPNGSGGDPMLAVLTALKELVGQDGTVTVSSPRARAEPPSPPPASLRQRNRILLVQPASRIVDDSGRRPMLTRLEFELLHFLARNPDRAFTRRDLLRRVWGSGSGAGARTVDVHIRRLRVKLAGFADALVTVRGVGYRLDGDAGIVIV